MHHQSLHPGQLALFATLLMALVSAPASGQAPNTARSDQPFTLSPTEHAGFLRLGTFEQTRHWAPMSSWVEPRFSHGEKPDDWNLFTPHPVDSDGGDSGALLGSPLAYPFAPVRNTMDRLYDRGIKINIYDVLMYQNVSRTIDGAARDSLFNRFDVAFHIHTWNLEGQGSGVLTADFRANNNLLDTATPGEAVGAFGSLDVVANNNTFLINRLEFQQTLFEGRASLTIGKGNPNDTIASNLFAWDETTQFVSSIFDGGNYPVGYGGYMPLVSLQVIPVDGFYVTGLINSGVGSRYQVFSTLGDGLYLCAGETGVVVEMGEEKLQGRYSVSLMNSNTGNDTVDRATRTSGNAMALVAQQQIAESTAIWSQYLLCDEQIGPAEQEFTIGLSIEDCFGRSNDGFGIGFGWSKPSSSAYPGWRDNVQLETYYRLQLTESLQLSPDFQVLSHPSDPSAEDKPVYSFALRLMTRF
jgi:carbohydrate-selective porin OprB